MGHFGFLINQKLSSTMFIDAKHISQKASYRANKVPEKLHLQKHE